MNNPISTSQVSALIATPEYSDTLREIFSSAHCFFLLALGCPPGYQASEGTPSGTRESDKYNEKIRSFTLDAAILPHLKRLAGATASMFPEFDAVIEKHFELKEHALKIQLSQWRKYKAQETPHPQFPSYMNNLHHARNSGPTMETLYIACVAAIDSWPRKQKARKYRNSASTASSPILLGDSNNQAVAAQPIHAVEVNGVIEIDLDDDIVDATATTNLTQSQITSQPPMDPFCSPRHAATEVIDLT